MLAKQGELHLQARPGQASAVLHHLLSLAAGNFLVASYYRKMRHTFCHQKILTSAGITLGYFLVLNNLLLSFLLSLSVLLSPRSVSALMVYV